MPRARIIQDCDLETCDVEHYAKGLCKAHYMAANRSKFNAAKGHTGIQNKKFDYEDFWDFVKEELKLG